MDTFAEVQHERKLVTSMRQPFVVGVNSQSYAIIERCLKAFRNLHVLPVDPTEWKPLDAHSAPHLLIFDLSSDLLTFLKRYEQHQARHRWIVLGLIEDKASPDLLSECLDHGLDDCLDLPSLSLVLQNRVFGLVERLTLRAQRQLEQRWVDRQYGKAVDEVVNGHMPFSSEMHNYLLTNAVELYVPDGAISNGGFALAVPRLGKGYVLAIGEVSGVGSASPLCTIPITETLEGMVRNGSDLSDIARHINGKIRRYLSKGQFCRCALVEVVFTKRLLKVWSGGFPLLYCMDDQNNITRIPSQHAPLGVLSDVAFDDYLQYFPMKVGSQLFGLSVRQCWVGSSGPHCLDPETVSAVLEESMVTPEKLSDDSLPLQNTQRSETDNDQLEMDYIAACGLGKELSHSTYRLIDTVGQRLSEVVGSSSNTEHQPDHLITLMRVRMIDSSRFLIGSAIPEGLSVSSPMSSNIKGDGPSDWTLTLKLNPQSLRQFDPLPLLFQLIREVPGLAKIHASVYTVLSELYTNALEHGVLQLSSHLKQDVRGFGEYYRLRKDRLDALSDGFVQINLRHENKDGQHKLEICVEDSGEGFDHQKEYDRSSLLDYAGRGIVLLKNLCSSVSWQGRGNSVRAIMTCSED